MQMDKIMETIQQINLPATTWVFPITKGQAVNILVSMLEGFRKNWTRRSCLMILK